MIRFSAFLVVVAVGMLVAGVVTSKLLLVYIAIGVSGVALLALGIGAAVNWRELTGKPETAAAETSAQGPAAAAAGRQAPAPQVSPAWRHRSRSRPPRAAAAPAGSGGPPPLRPARPGPVPAHRRR